MRRDWDNYDLSFFSVGWIEWYGGLDGPKFKRVLGEALYEE